jgi:hypothetical protein
MAASCNTKNNGDDIIIIEDDDIIRFEPPEDYTYEDSDSILSEIDNSETGIMVITQEYIGDNIAEILMLKYDGSQPEFEQYNWKNPEIEMINLTIKSGIQQMYNDFMNDRANGGDDFYDWIEIKSYPFTSENYVQIVTTSIIYPTYGTDGDITSYNFDKNKNKWITLDDAMKEWGLTKETITENVKKLYVPEDPSTYIKEVTPTGFLMRYATDPYIIFLLEVTTDNPESIEWKSFYAYEPNVLTRQLDEFYKLNNNCLFDPYDMDIMEPPLSYQKYMDENMGMGAMQVMDLLNGALGERMKDGFAIVYTGDDEVNGEMCYLFSFGDNTPEKFTAFEHYAVTDNSEIFIMDYLTGEYEPFAMG